MRSRSAPVSLALTVLVGACGPDSVVGTGGDAATDGSTGTPSEAAETSATEASEASSESEEPQVFPETFGPGERLHPVVARTQSGEQTLHYWHDTELDIDCQLRFDYRGDVRCLPRPTSGTDWADSSCTVPAVFDPAARFSAGDLVSVYLATCGTETGYTVVRVLERITEIYSELGGCHPIFNDGSSDGSRAEEVPLEDFALAQLDVVTDGTTLGRVVASFDGGAWAWIGAHDGDNDDYCETWTVGGTDVCVPRNRAVLSSHFGSDDCEGVALASARVPSECAPPKIAADAAAYELTEGRADGMWALGDAVAFEDTYVRANSGECRPDAPDEFEQDTVFWPVTPLGAEAFPVASPVEGEGERFRPLFLADAGGALASTLAEMLRPQAWSDTELGFRCIVDEAADGSVACVPEPRVLSGRFADSDCTEPVILDHIPVLGGGPVVAGEWISVVYGDDSVHSVGVLGELDSGSLYQRFAPDDACELDGGNTFYRVENSRPVAELPSFDLVEIE